MLDTISGDATESEFGDEDIESGESSNERRQSKRRKELIALVAADDRGQISMAVEALWDEVASVSEAECSNGGLTHIIMAAVRPSY